MGRGHSGPLNESPPPVIPTRQETTWIHSRSGRRKENNLCAYRYLNSVFQFIVTAMIAPSRLLKPTSHVTFPRCNDHHLLMSQYMGKQS
jgi:hypothetical protein